MRLHIFRDDCLNGGGGGGYDSMSPDMSLVMEIRPIACPRPEPGVSQARPMVTCHVSVCGVSQAYAMTMLEALRQFIS